MDALPQKTPDELLADAVSEFEAGLIVSDGYNTSLAPTGEEFIVLISGCSARPVAYGLEQPYAMATTPELAIDLWALSATRYKDRHSPWYAKKLFWRRRPVLEHIALRDGSLGDDRILWRVYSRMRISDK